MAPADSGLVQRNFVLMSLLGLLNSESLLEEKETRHRNTVEYGNRFRANEGDREVVAADSKVQISCRRGEGRCVGWGFLDGVLEGEVRVV